MTIQQLLGELAVQLKLPGLQLDNTGSCAIDFDSDVHLDLHYEDQPQVLCLATPVTLLSDADKAQIIPALLRANLDTRALDEAHFALRPNGDVCLCKTLNLENLNVVRLMSEMARLVTACRRWRQRLVEQSLVIS